MKETFRMRQILLVLPLVAASGCSHAPSPVGTTTSATAAEALAEPASTSSPAAMSAVEEDEADPPATRTPAVRTTRLHEKPALVNVRPEPGTTRAPIAVLKGGKVVEVLEEQGGWLKIRWLRKTGKVEGWVSRKFVNGYD